jgi:hypothetical protein
MLWKRLLTMILIVINLIVFYNMVYAATTREVGVGKTYATIQAAVNAASCGDTILVYAGTYAGFSTTQNCNSGAYLTIQANTGDTVNINSGTTINHTYHKMIGFNIHPSSGGCVTVEKDDTKDGSYFEFRNNFCCPAGAGNTGIMYPWHSGTYGASHTVIDGNRFGHCEYDGHLSAIRLRGSDNQVTNNIFDYWGGGDGIYLLARNSIIRGNEFKNQNHMISNGEHPDCIQTQASANDENYNNVIEDNYFHNNMGQQIYTELTGNSHDIIVRNNIFAICGAKGVQTSGTGWKVYNNTFYLCTKNTANPIGLSSTSTGSEIKNNITVGCGMTPTSNQQGWFADDSLSVVHSNNFVAGICPSYGIKNINYTGGNTVLLSSETGLVNGGNPKFINVPVDFVFSYYDGVSYGGDSSHFEVSVSDAAKFTVGEYAEYCPYTTGCDGIPRQITGKSDGIISFSPAISGYTAPNCGGDLGADRCSLYIVLWGTNHSDYKLNLKLLPDSPAIYAGTNLSSFFDQDKTGIYRPKPPEGWDIGAYEHKRPLLRIQ